ncbi:glycosyltransferase family 2 protein [Curvibacter sp. RS43]|uniref:glycosyltransferase family 2 protein n=1 Tax=Curvibacter microcysteis TaxID=3026419 RepID=UPI0023605303|nr:glycosyltransferase family 2 protein [Curvibacter sp. RS43]MDD0811217.1 glycosyltransferase family 2 protein [Curvibacter sp. RS43]
MMSPDTAALLSQVTVLVVTYNSGHCLPALAQGLAQLPHVRVVDNASQDGTPDTVRRLLPSAQLTCLPSNKGYGVANNAGLAEVSTPYALLLNPDCEVTPESIAALVQAARQWPEATLLVPQLVDGQGALQVNYSWPRHDWKPRQGAADGPLSVGYACAAVMLIHMARLQPVGFFDPRFFLYYEDEDLCLRVFQRHGQILVLPDIRVTHLSRGSVRGPRPWRSEYWRGYHHAQSKIIFIHKHAGAAAGARAQRRLMLSACANVLVRALLVSPKHLARAWGRLRGVWQLPPLA